MLFFEQIRTEKLADTDFRELFEKECHICGTTLELASILDRMPDAGQLETELDIPGAALDSLVQAEYCDPELVVRLCRRLGVDADSVVRECPRLAARTRPGCRKKGTE